MSPRVSIVVRTKDRPQFLTRAIEDVLSQSLQEWELIVTNDGGDVDQVRAVVEKFSSREGGRIRVVDVVGVGGRCAAANQGIEAGTAPFVVLHDDDDLWHRDFLSRTVRALEARPDDGGVMVATAIIIEERRGEAWVETQRVPFWEGLTGVTFTSLLEVNRAVPISFLYRRSLHDELGWYDESLDAVEDWEFYLRVTARYAVAFIGGEPLAFWTQRPRATGTDANSMFELARLHERDDLAVRDAALRQWVAANGPGLPLYMALIEKRMMQEVREQLDRQREAIVREIYDRHPVWRRLRKLTRRSEGLPSPGRS